MPRIDLPVTKCTRLGIDPTAGLVTGDVGNGHSFVNDERTFLLIRNGDGAAPHTVTPLVVWTSDGLVLSSAIRALSVPANERRFIGPFPAALYGQSTDGGKVWVDVDSSQLLLKAISIPIT